MSALNVIFKHNNMNLLEQIKENAKRQKQTIVLPEGYEERTIKAADAVIEQGIADIILIGNKAELEKKAADFGLKNIAKAQIVDPEDHPRKQEFIDKLVELRKNKGMTPEEAARLLKNPLYLGAMMVKVGMAKGEVAGADNATGDVLRPAFQIVKTKPGISCVSGAFVMVLKDKTYGQDGIMVFADCAVLPVPTAPELAQIAVESAKTAKAIACIDDPKVAILSFSTKGSAKHEVVDKVIEATKLAQEMAPELKIDGELQADAAIVPGVAAKKAPGSDIAGKANVLVFPSLETGNICYKLVQRLGNAEAYGPILQGMAAPINDLSRGCSVEDVVNVIAITCNQAIALNQ